MLDARSKRDMVQFCRELIRIPSLSTREGDVAQFALQRMKELGYDHAWIDEMGNVVGTVGSGSGPSILFDSHIDHVDVTDRGAWTDDPYSGSLIGDRIYGRGAADMKGAFAAMIYGIAALVRSEPATQGTVLVSGTVCEELVEGPALGYVIEHVRPNYVVIGESTGLNLNIGQRGRAEVIVEVFGRPAHSANPELGLNAVMEMASFLPALSQMCLPSDELLGSAIIELTDIISRPYPGASTVPDLCRATFDRRIMPSESMASVLDSIRAAMSEHSELNRSFCAHASIAAAQFETYTGYCVKVPKFAPAWKIELDSPLVVAAVRALSRLGRRPEIGAYSFCTNGSYSAGKLGVPTIGLGPGAEAQAHIVDEYISTESLCRAAECYESVAREVCGPGAP